MKNKSIIRLPVQAVVILVENLQNPYITTRKIGFDDICVYLKQGATSKQLHRLISKRSQEILDEESEDGLSRNFYDVKMKVTKITFKGEEMKANGRSIIESGDGYQVYFKTLYKPKQSCIIFVKEVLLQLVWMALDKKIKTT